MNANTDQLNMQISENAGYQLTASSYSMQMSAFPDANDIRIKNSSFNMITNLNTASSMFLWFYRLLCRLMYFSYSEPMETLYQRVAPHAISNEGGRADNPKCHPGTREEVIDLLEKWMNAAESNRILWLSGPAGGGKTAIVKTLTERSTDRGVRAISFYFFRGDSTRNGAQPVIPTLLYQLFQFYPRASEVVANILSTHPRALDGSLAEQFKLISRLIPIIQQSSPANTPVLLFVDGLDECDIEAEFSQADLIHTLSSLVMDKDSPFRLLVASRPEARIRMALNRLSSPAHTIFLDEQYSPEKDIRVFVTAEFDGIKVLHPSAHLLEGDWPSPLDIEEIVRKSSGQFIYAATVMRYVSRPSTVPSLSLQQVQGIVPAGKNSPFAHLDSIYTFILMQADDQEATREMLSITLLDTDLARTNLLYHYNSRYTHALIESCISQLSAIVELTEGINIRLYHASLADFLVDKDRSGVYWVDVDAFRVNLLMGIWNVPPTILAWNAQLRLFLSLPRPNHDITHMLLNLPFPEWPISEHIDPDGRAGYQSTMRDIVYRLYDADNNDTAQRIIRRLEEDPRWLLQPKKIAPPTQEDSSPSTEANGMPFTKIPLFSFKWWRKILPTKGRA
ncbi:hypothetical protein D9619_000297 [Psilocybe cf. subviscida]|uniref:NACHT domain-containing protein n=1 Tax=Psilocybe cf. subviscida TaxID=2480587 RepID=A0A8H5F3C9_9AGAR|nr:hypothetical protein D9619_000297 [Psilocybe cf. subviscida]